MWWSWYFPSFHKRRPHLTDWWCSLCSVCRNGWVWLQWGRQHWWPGSWATRMAGHTPGSCWCTQCLQIIFRKNAKGKKTHWLPRSWSLSLSDLVVNTLDKDSTSLWTSSLRQLNDLTSCDLARWTLRAAGDDRRWEEPVYTQHRSSRRSPAATRGQVLSMAQVLRVAREASISQVTRLGQGSSWAQATLSFIITWWLTVRTLLSTNTLVPAERKLGCVGNIWLKSFIYNLTCNVSGRYKPQAFPRYWLNFEIFVDKIVVVFVIVVIVVIKHLK